MSYKNNNRKMKFSTLAAILVCAILGSSALLAGVGFMSKGFTNTDVGSWFQVDANENNLLKVEDYVEDIDKDLENGLKIDVKDNGKIVLSGTVKDDTITGDQSPTPLPFASITLDAGKVYNLSSGNQSADKNTFGMLVEWLDADGVKTSVKVGGDDYILDLTEYEEPVTLTLSIYYENNTMYFGIFSYLMPEIVVSETATENT